MTQPSHRLCPVCGVAFFGGEPVLQCSGCHAVHHPACWIESDGCATAGEHESQPLPRTFGGVPPPAPASRPVPPPPAPSPPPAPLPERQPLIRPRNIGSLGLDSRGVREPLGLLRFWYVPVGFLIAAAVAYGVVLGIDRLRDDGGDQAAAPVAVEAPSPTPAPTTPATTSTLVPSTPEPTPTPSPTPIQPLARFSLGDAAVVAGTDSCLNIRGEASIEAEVIDCIADGTNVTVLEGPVSQGNLTWWLVAAPAANGWAAELYLVKR